MATLTSSYQYLGRSSVMTSTSGTLSYYVLLYGKTSANQTTGIHTVTIKEILASTSTNATFYLYSTSHSGTVAGKTAFSGSNEPNADWELGSFTAGGVSYKTGTLIGEGSATVDCTDGAAHNVTLSCSWKFNDTADWYTPAYGTSRTVSVTSTLAAIPRASTITSASNVTLGNKCSIKWTPANSSFKYKIKFALGSWSYTTPEFISPGTTSAYTYTGYTIPSTSDLLDDIPNSTTGTMAATLYTYNSSGTQIGSTSQKTFTVTVPSSVIPTVGTITLNPVDINSQNILVQGKNKLTISVSGCSAGTGSSIKSYKFSGPGISSTTTSTSATSGSTISNTGTLTYTVTVTDNRGRTASKTASIACYAWSAPSITLNAYRVATNSSTTEDDNGTYVRCVYSLSYASVNNTNDVTVTIYYKKNTASTWTSKSVLTNSKSTSGSVYLSSFDIGSTYTIYATITDNYSGSSNSSNTTIFSAERIINIRPKGKGLALGKMADTDDVFDSKWPIRSDHPEPTMKNLTYRGTNTISSTTNDTTSNWGNQGNLATVFYNTTGQITDQPSQYGFLLNLTNGPGSSEVHHIWATQSSGSLLHRGGNSNGWNGSWRTVLDSANYKSFAYPQATTLYNSSGNAGTITLSYAVSNYTYLEIFYKDNNSNGHSCMKVYSPDGKKIDLSIIEASDTTASRTYIRRTMYTISGTTITPNVNISGFVQIDGTTITQTSTGTNYLRITRVLGYA